MLIAREAAAEDDVSGTPLRNTITKVVFIAFFV
jgi:hypothetical protein